MRVAFGLDGVFADVEGAVARLSTEVLEAPIPRLTSSQHRILSRVVCASENFWEHLEEIEPGAIARLASVARARQWEVIFLVRRFSTAGTTTQRQSQNWLTAKGFEQPSVYVVDSPLAELVPALTLDVFVDSPIEHRIEAPTQERAVTSMGSIDECLRRLCEFEDERHPWYRRLAQSAAFFLP